MNTSVDTQSPERLFEEACGNFELGLIDSAENLIVHYEALFGADSRSCTLKKAVASTRGDYRTCAILAREAFEDSPFQVSDLHAVNMAGDPTWAYEKCKTMPRQGFEPLYWFNRACFASQVGEFRDAVMSLLISFCNSDRYRADAFLDPDLLPLWLWMRDSELDDAIAELIAHPGWLAAINSPLASSESLTITPRMRGNVPPRFRGYLPVGTMRNGLHPNASMPGALYDQYLAWQRKTASRQVEVLQAACDRAQSYLATRQPAFAHWQAKNGNPTAARYHILFFLANFPERLSELEFLREFGMAYVLDDMRDALSEDENFAAVMHAVMKNANLDEIREMLAGVGPVGKTTVIYKLRLASQELESGRSESATELIAEVVKAWPQDATGYAGLTRIYIENRRWEEARLSFNAAPLHYRKFWIYGWQREQIGSEGSPNSAQDKIVIQPFYGQRHLGRALSSGWLPCEKEIR